MASVFPLARHRLSVEQFHEMGRAGILAHDSRVELIDGELIDMAPIGSRHASVVAALARLFVLQCGEAIVFTQNPISLPPYSEPRPDLALLAPQADRYWSALPVAAHVLLVVEVAETTLRYDQGVKLPLYARHGVREAWIIDVPGRRLDIYREPSNGVYTARIERLPTDIATPEVLPDIRIDLAQVFAQ